MVAGASGIDLFLVAIAADDGVMPQTREHLTVLEALGVSEGVVAITKVDAAPAEAVELATEEARELVPGAAIVPVSARTGEGMDALRRALLDVAAGIRARTGAEVWPPRAPVMHLDRVFTLRGIGTVVTGTLASGTIADGDEVRMIPSERIVRVRSIQHHDEPVDRVVAGQRAALNLASVDRDELERGDVITAPEGGPVASFRLDVALDFDDLPRRVQVHHGTRSVAARAIALDGDLVQLRLEAPLVARAEDRFVVRRIAPPGTLGGGVVVDPAPPRHGPASSDAIEALRGALDGEPEAVLTPALKATGARGLPADPASWAQVPILGYALGRFGRERWERAAETLLDAGAVGIGTGSPDRAREGGGGERGTRAGAARPRRRPGPAPPERRRSPARRSRPDR